MNVTSPGNPNRPLADQASQGVDQLAQKADDAIRSTQRSADGAFDTLSDKVEDARAQTGPALSKVATQAEAAARRGMAAVRDSSQQLRERAVQASDHTVAYIKDEPVKSMLIAAATGAALMGLISLMGRSRD